MHYNGSPIDYPCENKPAWVLRTKNRRRAAQRGGKGLINRMRHRPGPESTGQELTVDGDTRMASVSLPVAPSDEPDAMTNDERHAPRQIIEKVIDRQKKNYHSPLAPNPLPIVFPPVFPPSNYT